jgi:TonB family protein
MVFYKWSYFMLLRNIRSGATLLAALVYSSLAFCGAIHDAAEAGDLAKIKALLKNNSELISSKENDGSTPLHAAAFKGHRNVAEFLLANKADANARDKSGYSPLHLAVLMGNKDTAALLITGGADVNARDKNGFTPLHAAGRKDIAELLMANKADVNAVNNNGSTPLHTAAQKGHKDVAALLLADKADVNARDNDAITPLHLTAFAGHKDVAEFLLANKADVGAQNNLGWTPLWYAAWGEHQDVAELLLANKADVNARDKFGYTLSDMTSRNGIPSALNRLGIGIGRGRAAGQGFGTGSATGFGRGAGTPAGPFTIGNGIQAPVALAQPMPPYTDAARAAHIEGIIQIQAVIRKDGTVDVLKVLKGLGYGLDESAIHTLKTKWRFKPGTRNGEPVDVTVTIEVRFRMF